MALQGGRTGVSTQGLTTLQRLARLYEGECWWLSGPGEEVRGLLCLDGGADLLPMRAAVMDLICQGYGLTLRRETVLAPGREAARPGFSRHDCQVTVEERSHLFGMLGRGK